MSQTIAEMLVAVRADVGSALAGLEETDAALNSLGGASQAAASKTEAATGVFGRLGNTLSEVGRMAAGMATGMLVANLTMGVAERFGQAAEAIDVFGKSVAGVQRLTGESAESASLLLGTLTRFGMSSEQASTALVKLDRSLAGLEDPLEVLQSGGKTGAQQLTQLGISTVDATGHLRTASAVLLDVADAIHNMTPAGQIGVISTLFKVRGNEAADLQRVLAQGRGAIEDYFQVLRSTGNVLSQGQVDDVMRFAAAHRQLDVALSGLSKQLGVAFMPAITSTAEAVSGLTRVVVDDLVPMIKNIPGWIVPGALAVTGLSVGFTLLKLALSPLGSLLSAAFSAIAKLAGVVFAQGAVATVAAGQNAVLAGSETAAGNAAALAAPRVAGFGAAAAGALGSVVALAAGLAALAAASAMPIIGINAEQSAGDINKKVLAALPDDARKEAQDYINANMQTIADAGGGAISQTGTRLVLDKWLKEHGYDESALIGSSGGSSPSSIIDTIKSATDGLGKSIADQLPTFGDAGKEAGKDAGDQFGDGLAKGIEETAAVKAAKAAKEAADAVLKGIQDESAGRKLNFELAHVDDERGVLTAKLGETEAEGALIGLKRQMEDLDRNAVNYAQKRLELDQQDAVTRAKLAESAVKANDEDLSYQQRLLKAELVASRHGGPAVDRADIRQQLRELHNEQLRLAPSLLIAEHNTTLASRVKESTDLTGSLAKNDLERHKLAIQQAMAPFETAAVFAKRTAEDTQRSLDLAKQNFAIWESYYEKDRIRAEIAAKDADRALIAAQADASKQTVNVNINAGAITVNNGGDPAAVRDAVLQGVTQAVKDARTSGPMAVSPRLGGAGYTG